MITSVENEAIHADFRLLDDTDFVDKPRHAAKSTKRCHQIAIPQTSLYNIAGASSMDKELRLVEDLLRWYQWYISSPELFKRNLH